MNIPDDLARVFDTRTWLVNIPVLHGPDAFERVEVPPDGQIYIDPSGHEVAMQQSLGARRTWINPGKKITEIIIRVVTVQ